MRSWGWKGSVWGLTHRQRVSPRAAVLDELEHAFLDRERCELDSVKDSVTNVFGWSIRTSIIHPLTKPQTHSCQDRYPWGRRPDFLPPYRHECATVSGESGEWSGRQYEPGFGINPSLDNEDAEGCTELVPWFHRKIRAWWNRVKSLDGEAKHAIYGDGMLDSLEISSPFLAAEGAVRITKPEIIHDSTLGWVWGEGPLYAKLTAPVEL